MLGVALALLFLLVLAAKAPARLVGYLLPEDKVYLSGYSGTLWDGVASTAAVATNQGWVQLGRLQWSLSQLYLLLFSLSAQLESEWGQQRLRAHITLYPSGDIRVLNLDTSFSAALLTRWLPAKLRGDINVTMDQLKLSDGDAQSGAGRVVWQRAAWRGTLGSQPLGDYVLQFEVVEPQRARGNINTLAGPIEIEGNVNFNGRQYAVDATMRSDKPFDPELASALALMAAPVEGGYELKFESEL
jgi:hypothetical protein